MNTSPRLRILLMLQMFVAVMTSLVLFIPTSSEVYAASAKITLSPKNGPPTSLVKVHGTGFGASETVVVEFDKIVVGTGTTDSSGSFMTTITVPSSAFPGKHHVLARGNTSGFKAQATFLVRTNWAMYGFNAQHTSFNPYENVLNTSNISRLTAKWNDPEGYSTSSPTVVNGVIYIADPSGIQALQASTGAVLWTYGTYNIVENSSAAVANNTVYIDSAYDSLLALNARTGTLKWQFGTGPGGGVGSPMVAGGLVYIGTGNGFFYALNAKTGTPKWSYMSREGITSPAIDNGIVYFGSNHTLYAFNALIGTMKWSYTTGNFIESSPAVANGIVYFGSVDHKIYALDALTGTMKWSYTTGAEVDASAAIANGVVYIGSYDGNLYALDTLTGSLQWKFNLFGPPIFTAASVANGVVYFDGSDNTLRALDAATGTLLWSQDFSTAQDSSPTIADGVVYFATQEPGLGLYALSLP